jgi:hypothetical protein
MREFSRRGRGFFQDSADATDLRGACGMPLIGSRGARIAKIVTKNTHIRYMRSAPTSGQVDPFAGAN